MNYEARFHLACVIAMVAIVLFFATGRWLIAALSRERALRANNFELLKTIIDLSNNCDDLRRMLRAKSLETLLKPCQKCQSDKEDHFEH